MEAHTYRVSGCVGTAEPRDGRPPAPWTPGLRLERILGGGTGSQGAVPPMLSLALLSFAVFGL